MQEITWQTFFSLEESEPYFSKIKSILERDYDLHEITPYKQDVFKVFEFPFKDIKVVIIGQDPYPEKGVADGLAFSGNGSKIPASLKNIYREIEFEYGCKNNSPKLNYLAQQGVFLLNIYLTTKVAQPLFHKNIGWEIFTKKTISFLSENKQNLVFILFGNFAKNNFSALIDKTKHLVLETTHPSPLSFYKGFFRSNIFKTANEYLQKHKLTEINWCQQCRN